MCPKPNNVPQDIEKVKSGLRKANPPAMRKVDRDKINIMVYFEKNDE